MLVGQGLAAPRGAQAWTTLGLAGLALQAKPLADCGPDELWRGLLGLALQEYRHLVELLEHAEQRLDTAGRVRLGHAPLQRLGTGRVPATDARR